MVKTKRDEPAPIPEAEDALAGTAFQEGERDDRYIVPALDRGLQILSLFSRTEQILSRTAIVRRLNLPHATVYRLLYTLERRGLLRRVRSDYALGARILTLGFEYLASQEITDLARPELEALRDATGISVNMGILDGREVIYTAHVPSLHPMLVRMVVGSRLPAHVSSIGRLLLAELPADELDELYRGVELKRISDGTQITVESLKRQLEEDRARGYVISHGIYDAGIIAIASAIFDSRGKAVAGVNISGPAISVGTPALEAAVRDRVCLAGRKISESLGCRPALRNAG